MQKQAAVLIIGLSLIVVSPHLSSAFEYDVWKAGIAISEALEIAEMHDIPLTCAEFKAPLQRGRDHYRSDIVEQAKRSRNLCYKQKLRGTTALVTLHFTPMSKKLSRIWISWSDADRAQLKEVILALSEKYGEPLKYNPEKEVLLNAPGIRPKTAFTESQFFAAGQQNIISVHYVQQAKNDLRIIYHSKSMLKQEQTEIKTFEHYFKTRYRQQDDNRM